MGNDSHQMTIAELRSHAPGEQAWGKFVILELQKRRTKDGKEICNLRLADRTGDIECVIWDGATVHPEFTAGKLMGAMGDIGQYNNRPQFIIRRFKLLDEDITPYLPGPSDNLESLQQRFTALMAQVQDPRLVALLHKVFTPQVKERFFIMPGGRKIHHAYRGGLLEHSVSMAEMAILVAEHYPQLNKDVLLTGTLLHDIGKIEEYELQVMAEFTPPGKLLGHLVIGTRMVAEKIEELRQEGMDFPQELDWMLQHMLLSHHGEMQFGSPVVPMCPEAYALHMIDNLDAKLFVFFERTQDNTGGNRYFSAYDPVFQQQFYKYRP